MILRPHQEKVVRWARERSHGLVISPAGSGKSLMMAAIAKEFIHKYNEPIGVLAPTNETCAQCYTAMESLGVDMSFMEIRCPHLSVDFSNKGLVLVDECKHFPTNLYKSCFKSGLPNAMFGFDATPFKDFDDERNEELSAIFGDQSITIDRSEIGESLCEASVVLSDSTDANLEDRINSNTEKLVGIRKRFMRIPEGELRAMCLWQSIIDIGIVNNRARNLQVVRWAKTHPGEQVLALVPSVTLGEQLEAQIPNSLCVHSKLGAKKRKAAMDSFRAGDLKCMIATSLADEGLDLPNAKVLILVSGGRSSQKTVQRTARVLRSHHSKDGAIIYDFKDTFHPLAAKHATLRQGIYKELGYSFA